MPPLAEEAGVSATTERVAVSVGVATSSVGTVTTGVGIGTAGIGVETAFFGTGGLDRGIMSAFEAAFCSETCR